MQIDVVRGSDLDAATVRAWTELQSANPELASPYFAPEFTQAVAAVCDNVHVGIVKNAGTPVAFFPFQRKSRSIGIPVAGILSDYQGLISRPECEFQPLELIRRCGMVAWDFDHLLMSQTRFSPFHRWSEPSPQIDLSQGYECYIAQRRAAGSEQIKKCNNLMRRIEREVGPLRFVAHSTDTAMLRRTLAWKSQQYLSTGKPDLFAPGVPQLLIERIHATQTEGCAGMLSLLFAGDRLVAGHMGMRSRTVWHYWFPAYDEVMGIYSPGLILLLKLAEYAPSVGIRTIDLGKGLSLYKDRLMNASVAVATGSVETPSLLRCRRSAYRLFRRCLARSGLAKSARNTVNWVRQRI